MILNLQCHSFATESKAGISTQQGKVYFSQGRFAFVILFAFAMLNLSAKFNWNEIEAEEVCRWA